MPEAIRDRANRTRMRVLKTIRLKCGRIVYRRGKVIDVVATKPWIKKWVKEGKLEACI